MALRDRGQAALDAVPVEDVELLHLDHRRRLAEAPAGELAGRRVTRAHDHRQPGRRQALDGLQAEAARSAADQGDPRGLSAHAPSLTDRTS